MVCSLFIMPLLTGILIPFSIPFVFFFCQRIVSGALYFKFHKIPPNLGSHFTRHRVSQGIFLILIINTFYQDYESGVLMLLQWIWKKKSHSLNMQSTAFGVRLVFAHKHSFSGGVGKAGQERKVVLKEFHSPAFQENMLQNGPRRCHAGHASGRPLTGTRGCNVTRRLGATPRGVLGAGMSSERRKEDWGCFLGQTHRNMNITSSL